ncbi:hypothetical protein Esti_005020 [Eimeria stiedai]
MTRTGKQSPAPPLPLFAKQDVKASPRGPLSSHRMSVASTGEGEGLTPLLLSPKSTYRSTEPYSPRPWSYLAPADMSLPPRRQRVGALQRTTPRPAHRVAGETPVTGLPRTYLSPEIAQAKKRGGPLPPLKATSVSMLHEDITPDTAKLIGLIPLRAMLEGTGAAVYSNDPMFTEDVVQYQKEHPIPPGVLHRYPKYEKFPLLLNRIYRPKLQPNIAGASEVAHLRGYNEALLENEWRKDKVRDHVPAREAYMYVPNFGRVQVMFSDYPDGSSYPFVTLPKMTPHDILQVLDKQRLATQKSWASWFKRLLHRASCGVF